MLSIIPVISAILRELWLIAFIVWMARSATSAAFEACPLACCALSAFCLTVDIAKRNKAVQLEVAGYSDNVGNPAVNLAVSSQRAQAVRTYLVAQGVPPSTLSAKGHGEANPVDSNETDGGRFHNRRIEFVSKQ